MNVLRTLMTDPVPVSPRAYNIEYAIRDVVVPAIKLESQGKEIIRLNIGDPLAYDGLPTPIHMIEAFKNALDRQDNGYGPSYGLPGLRSVIASSDTSSRDSELLVRDVTPPAIIP